MTNINKMKNMRSTKTVLMAALAAGALLAGNSALQAQSTTNLPPAGQHPPGMRGRPNMAKALDLTEDQKPKVEKIMKDAFEKRKALREDTSLTPQEKKAKNKEIQEEVGTQLKAVLTPEQYTKWEEMSKRGPRTHPATAPAAPPANSAAGSKD